MLPVFSPLTKSLLPVGSLSLAGLLLHSCFPFFSPLRLFAVSSVKHNPLAECRSTAQEERDTERGREREREQKHRDSHKHTGTHSRGCVSTHLCTCSCCTAETNATHQNTGGQKDERNARHCFPLFPGDCRSFCLPPAFQCSVFFLLSPSQIKGSSGTGKRMDEETQSEKESAF